MSEFPTTPDLTNEMQKNAEAIAEIADNYNAQRDPRRTAKVIGDIMAECARRLCVGHDLNGTSFEAQATIYAWDDLPAPTRDDLVRTAAAYVEQIARLDYWQELPSGWSKVPVTLSLMSSKSGLVAVCAAEPRNLFVTGKSLENAFESFVQFLVDCASLGKPFAAFDGVKLRQSASETKQPTPPTGALPPAGATGDRAAARGV